MEEICNEMIKYCDKVYYSPYKTEKRDYPKAFVVTHCLESGGAPLVLLELLEELNKIYNIVVVSMTDGNLYERFTEMGIDVYIGDIFQLSQCDRNIWKKFDLAFLNTIVTAQFLACFQNTNVTTLWWLHEPELLFRGTYGRCIPFRLLSDNIKILSVTRETQRCCMQYYNMDTNVLHMGLEDMYEGENKREETKIRFFQPGKFCHIKGQDIMARAILELPQEYMERAEFYFAGPKAETQEEQYLLIEKLAEALPNVAMLGEIDKKEVYECYKLVDCVVAPSRLDATPTTIVEGMMFNKLVLCSDATGISKYLEDGINGFIFESENVEKLTEKLMYIIDHYSELGRVRQAGRDIYLSQFEKSEIMKQLFAYIGKQR